MPKRFQSGGVFDVNPRPQDVGEIPVFNAPTFDIMSLPAEDVAALASKMQMAKAQKEASDLAEQRYQDSLENVYMDYSTKFFGNTHSATQKAKLEALKTKYEIPDQGTVGLLENQVMLKDTNRKFRQAMSDPDFISVVGEVDRGNKFRDYAEKYFDKETFVEWEQSAWQPYVTGQANLEDANPTRFKSAKAVNFASTMNTLVTGKAFDAYDFSNPVDASDAEAQLAAQYQRQNEDAAVKQGLITVNGGVAELTQPQKDDLRRRITARQEALQQAYDRDLEKYEAKKVISERFEEPPRTNNNSSNTENIRFPNLKTNAAIQVANVEYEELLNEVPNLSPNDPDLIRAAEVLATTSAATRETKREELVKELKNKGKNLTKELLRQKHIDDAMSGSNQREAIGNTPSSTPTATVTPVAPKIRFDPTNPGKPKVQ
jgi:hypothetical protein